MTTPIEQVEVTQADRDAAADLAGQFQRYSFVQIEAPAMRRGDHDDWELVQAFTRHRLASQASTDRPTSELVWIWSDEHQAYWRPDASGYTRRASKAGVYSRQEAERLTSHCGPEKRIEIEPVAATHITTLEAKIAGLQAAMRGAVEAAERTLRYDVDLMSVGRLPSDPREYFRRIVCAFGILRDELGLPDFDTRQALSDAPEDRGEQS